MKLEPIITRAGAAIAWRAGEAWRGVWLAGAVFFLLTALVAAWLGRRLPDQALRAPELAALGLLLAGTALNGVLIQALRRRAARLDEERAHAQRLLATQRVLFQELQHRVANNMQFVSSLLTLQARRVQDGPAREALLEATRRLDMLGRIHRRLYDPARAGQDFGRTVEEICRDLLEATGAANVACRVEMQAGDLDMDRLVSLSLIITELLTNALKHAFADGRPGEVVITLRPEPPGRYALEVRDNGPGLPEGLPARRGDSLGLRIIESLAARLEGTLTMCADGGTVTRVEFAA